MSLDSHRRDWEDLADLDPFWAVLSDPKRRFGRWNVEEFFETGEQEIEGLMRRAQALGHPREREAALDFGCGLGRVTRALACRFRRCHAVDIAEGMIARARELNEAFPACVFVHNPREDLSVFTDDRFDLVYTCLVLQHLPSRGLIEGYLRELVRVLRPGGLLAFQLPRHIRLLRRLRLRGRAYGILRALGAPEGFLYRSLGVHPIRMNFMPEGEVARIIASAAARILDVQRNPVAGVLNCVYYVTRP